MQAYLPDDEAIPTPVVDEAWMWIWRAFHRLSVDRPWLGGGMGPPVPGPIPWLSLIEYCLYHNYSREETDLADFCFRAMDVIFIKHHHNKNKSRESASAKHP